MSAQKQKKKPLEKTVAKKGKKVGGGEIDKNTSLKMVQTKRNSRNPSISSRVNDGQRSQRHQPSKSLSLQILNMPKPGANLDFQPVLSSGRRGSNRSRSK